MGEVSSIFLNAVMINRLHVDIRMDALYSRMESRTIKYQLYKITSTDIFEAGFRCRFPSSCVKASHHMDNGPLPLYYYSKTYDQGPGFGPRVTRIPV
jgi:hypothetical protein